MTTLRTSTSAARVSATSPGGVRGGEFHIHVGGPLSSWLDRTAMGVFVANVMRLPKQFPGLRFSIEYLPVEAEGGGRA